MSSARSLGALGEVLATPRVALREALGFFEETSGDLREASGVLGEAQEVSRACKADRGNVTKQVFLLCFSVMRSSGGSSGGSLGGSGDLRRHLGGLRELSGVCGGSS